MVYGEWLDRLVREFTAFSGWWDMERELRHDYIPTLNARRGWGRGKLLRHELLVDTVRVSGYKVWSGGRMLEAYPEDVCHAAEYEPS